MEELGFTPTFYRGFFCYKTVNYDDKDLLLTSGYEDKIKKKSQTIKFSSNITKSSSRNPNKKLLLESKLGGTFMSGLSTMNTEKSRNINREKIKRSFLTTLSKTKINSTTRDKSPTNNLLNVALVSDKIMNKLQPKDDKVKKVKLKVKNFTNYTQDRAMLKKFSKGIGTKYSTIDVTQKSIYYQSLSDRTGHVKREDKTVNNYEETYDDFIQKLREKNKNIKETFSYIKLFLNY